jgi:hypothetical protein
MYDVNGSDIAKFALQSSNGEFSLDGRTIDLLYYVFEAKSGHQAYATTRSMTTNQRDEGDEEQDE